jgi:glycosyltransferase involved in cell wall biosynthesis
MKDISIYLLTRNRPEWVLKAIRSILSQTHKDFELIVSDNSTDNLTQQVIKEANINDTRFSYIKREPQFSGIDHFNAIHKEVQSHYYMIFHDDDVMLPEMIEKLYRTISANDQIVAVGAFAYTVRNGKKIKGKIPKRKKIISSSLAMIDTYTSRGSMATFPSYMYNKYLMNGLLLEEKNGGKYSDCSFIVSLPQNGLVVHIPYRLMEYTIHKGQSSQVHEFSQYLSLIHYLKKIVGKEHVDKIAPLRVFNIYNETVRRFKQFGQSYRFSLIRFFFKYSPGEFFIKYIIRILTKK